MPCDYKKYPANWKTEIRPRILSRENNCCKECGVVNYAIGWRDEHGHWNDLEQSFAGDMYAEDLKEMGYKIIKIVLTVAHLNHDINDNRDENLAALCQLHHLRHDIEHHKKNSRETNIKKKKLQSLF